MKQVSVGIVGSGFAASLHGDAYRKIYGLEVKLAAVASVEDTVEAFAGRYNIPKIYRDFEELLKDPEIQVVDIITPPYLHVSMIRRALEAGKHVICEKPLTGYFGKPGEAEDQVGKTDRRKMYDQVIRQMDELAEVVEASGKLFMYAENFVYAPSVQKVLQFLKARKSKILYMRGEESHSGSHARHAAYWKYSGGGSFIRQGCHPDPGRETAHSLQARGRGGPGQCDPDLYRRDQSQYCGRGHGSGGSPQPGGGIHQPRNLPAQHSTQQHHAGVPCAGGRPGGCVFYGKGGDQIRLAEPVH